MDYANACAQFENEGVKLIGGIKAMKLKTKDHGRTIYDKMIC